MKRISWILVLGIVLSFGCKPQQDLLIGKWKVFMVDRDGEKIGGPGFNGSVFDFREDGTLTTTDPQSIERVVNYRKEEKTLVYLSDMGEEYYQIDTLTPEILRIFNDSDGIPTMISLLRLSPNTSP